MSLPTSLLSYQDCLKVFDEAVENEEGIRVKFPTRDEAIRFRSRLHYCRKLSREENARIYEKDQPMHGKSQYDSIRCTLKSTKTGHYVYLEHQTIAEGQIESLANVGDEEEVFVPPPQREETTSPPLAGIIENIRRRV